MYKFKDEFTSNVPDYVKGLQLAPVLLYGGGYDKVTICRQCCSTAYSYDRSQFRFCQQCGGTVFLSANAHRWIPPVYEKVIVKIWFWEYIKETDNVLQPGYWERSQVN